MTRPCFLPARPRQVLCALVLTTGSASGVALAQGGAANAPDDPTVWAGYTTYATPGLIDMPGALSRPDGELAFGVSHFRNQTRSTLSFQITPRLSGSFRYSALDRIRPLAHYPALRDRLDRSFSLHYRLMDEGRLRPALAVGMNDFLGSGIYAAEYMVATKTIRPGVRITGGIGWGRLAGVGGFDNPLGLLSERLKTRPRDRSSDGGTFAAKEWFRGDAAFFGGVEWQVNNRLRLVAEYSSDAYPNEDGAAFDRRSPVNFGLDYSPRHDVQLALRYLYGSEVGLGVTFLLNPKRPPGHGGYDPAPPPVVPRTARLAVQADEAHGRSVAAVTAAGAGVHALSIGRTDARIEIENTGFATTAQAIGRAARALTATLPPEVDTITVVPVRSGLAGAEVRVRRVDLEQLEHDADGSWRSYARAQIAPAETRAEVVPGRYPRHQFRLSPYLSPSLFDPDQPLRADAGLALHARHEPAPGLVLNAILRKKLVGNLDRSTRASTSVLEHVRSDFNLYERDGDPALSELTAAWYGAPAAAIHTRVTAGYLEPMFAGLSAEVLWKPFDSRFALGAELSHVRQRDFDQRLGLRDYGVTTGHVSAYLDMSNGFHGQLDAGRYLAGDWGATLTLDREFGNGWRVGAFATLTDVPFAQFGEGSFDKGLRLSVPLNWVTGRPSADRFSTVIRPVTRDGGARLAVSGRLYETVRDLHKPALADGWGRYWR